VHFSGKSSILITKLRYADDLTTIEASRSIRAGWRYLRICLPQEAIELLWTDTLERYYGFQEQQSGFGRGCFAWHWQKVAIDLAKNGYTGMYAIHIALENF
jgi:hypothetical protein